MKNLSIRLDPEVYRKAHAAAVAEGKYIGEWLKEAIEEKLEKKSLGNWLHHQMSERGKKS